MTRYASEVVIYKHGDVDGPGTDNDINASLGDLWVDTTAGSPVLKICSSSDGVTYDWEPVTTTSVTYVEPESYQTVAADVTLGSTAGKSKPDTAFLAPVMGNVFGTDLTKTGNYLGGIIGHYSINGTGLSTYPKGAILAGIGDGSTDAHGAVVAYTDGNSAVTQAGAAFKVMTNNSVPTSGFDYGLDLYCATRDGYPAVAYRTGDIRFSDGSVQTSAAVVRDARTAISSAQLLALDTTPVTIIPAPGVGKYLVLLHIDFYFKYGTVAYTAANPSTLNVFHQAAWGVDNITTFDLYNLIRFTRDTMRVVGGLAPVYNAVGEVPAQLENQPVQIQLAGGVAAPTLGDGVAYLNCMYVVVNIP